MLLTNVRASGRNFNLLFFVQNKYTLRQMRTQNFSLGWGDNPEAIYNLCLILNLRHKNHVSIAKSPSYGTPMPEQPVLREQWES
jgi:hypothetical protein